MPANPASSGNVARLAGIMGNAVSPCVSLSPSNSLLVGARWTTTPRGLRAAGLCTFAAAGRLVQVAIAASLGERELAALRRLVSYTFWGRRWPREPGGASAMIRVKDLGSPQRSGSFPQPLPSPFPYHFLSCL